MSDLQRARALFEASLDLDKVQGTLTAATGLVNAERLMVGLTHLRGCLEDVEVAGDIDQVSVLLAVLNDILAENGGRIRIHWVAE